MDTSCLTIPHLESLSTDELIGLAEKYELYLPDGLERNFIIEELWEISREDSDAAKQNNKSRDSESRAYSLNIDSSEDIISAIPTIIPTELPAVLPKQYNISFVQALVRDPLWVYIFWEISDHDRISFRRNRDFDRFCIRLIALDSVSLKPVNPPSHYIINITDNNSGRYLGFPPSGERLNKAELCAVCGGTYSVIAVSNEFLLPVLIEQKEERCNPLLALSGADNFIITRSTVREMRSSRQDAVIGNND